MSEIPAGRQAEDIYEHFQLTERADEIRRIVESESDRAAAVLGVAYLEALLGALLERFLADHSLSRQIVRAKSLRARAELALAGGLICQRLYGDLTLLREIRNRFAHRIAVHSFSDDYVRERCHRLHTPAYMQEQRDALGIVYMPRVQFELSLLFAVQEISVAISYVQHRVIPDCYGSYWQG